MRNFKIVLVLMALLGIMITVNAQNTIIRAYPKHGTVVKILIKPSTVVHGKTNFYMADGVWYKASGKKYIVCAAPIGVKISKLPRGNKVVMINGRKLYKYKGIWYRKSGRKYIVVNV